MIFSDASLRALDDVTFAQLRTFACAAHSGSFVRAGEQLGISQPAVSEHIDILERRLGRRLFERRRGTTPLLTVDGEEALEIVETMLAAGSRLFGMARKVPEKLVLRISIGPFLREHYLRTLMPRIYREHPDVAIELLPAASEGKILSQLERGDLDLAVFTQPVNGEMPPNSRLIRELPLVLVAPVGTRARLAAGECQMDDLQFIFPGRRDSAREARMLLRDLGLNPRKEPLFVEFVDALAQMVEDGQGIGQLMVDSVADRLAAGRLEALDIAIPRIRRLIGRSAHAPQVAKPIEDMLCEALST